MLSFPSDLHEKLIRKLKIRSLNELSPERLREELIETVLQESGGNAEKNNRFMNFMTEVCNSDGRIFTSPVGYFKQNSFGLFDVHGNVGEWVEDCYMSNYAGADGHGAAHISGDCNRRVVRGGSWVSNPQDLRSAFRNGITTDFRYHDLGFRIGRTLTP